jgi:hypothetical protein
MQASLYGTGYVYFRVSVLFWRYLHQIKGDHVVLKAPPDSVRHSGGEIAVSLSALFFVS